MHDTKIAARVLRFLASFPDQNFDLKTLAAAIHLKKHQFRLLKDTMNNLYHENQVQLKNRRFSHKAAKSKLGPKGKKADTKDTMKGTFDATALSRDFSYAFVRCEEKDILIFAEDTAGALHDDTVTVSIKRRSNGRLWGSIINIDQRARDNFPGHLVRYGQGWLFEPDNPIITQKFKVSDTAGANESQKVLLQVTNWGLANQRATGKVTEILGPAGDPEVEVLSVIRFYGLEEEFPPEVMAEVNNLTIELSEEEISARKDFRDLLTFTIDPVSAKDYDDAISYVKTASGWRLYVHIADVAHYVKPGSALFNEAAKRGNSFYFPKNVIPMLPKQLSNMACSLREGEDKPVLTVITDYDQNFKCLKQKVVAGVICSNARLSYQQVDDLIDGKPNDIPTEVATSIKQLQHLTRHLQQQRIERGYLYFSLPESEFVFGEQGHVQTIEESRETESHQLIENCMLVANQYTASLLTKFGRTTMYRIHEEPDDSDITALQQMLPYYGITVNKGKNYGMIVQDILSQTKQMGVSRVFDRIVLRSMKKAKYSTRHLPHFGLAINTYTHFTSPIRRLCDLVIHHQIHAWLNGAAKGSNLAFNQAQVGKYARSASERELLADEAEREVFRRNAVTFMRKRLGDEFNAIVIGVTKHKLLIQLDELPIVGVVPAESLYINTVTYDDQYRRLLCDDGAALYQLATKLKVRLDKADDDLFFTVLESSK